MEEAMPDQTLNEQIDTAVANMDAALAALGHRDEEDHDDEEQGAQ